MRYAFLLACLLWSGLLSAHHGGGGSGGGILKGSVAQKLEAPRSSLGLQIEYLRLDEGLGHMLLYQLEGEYALKPYLSLGLRVPFWTVKQDFLPHSDRFGDLTLSVKGRAWKQQDGKAHLVVGLETSLPTGDAETGRGAGVVALSPYATYAREWRPLSLWLTLMPSFELAGVANPTLSYELGLALPISRGEAPLYGIVGVQGLSYLQSDTFVSGSTKLYGMAGLLLKVNRHWDAAFLGRLSLADTLEFRDDVKSRDFATGLLQDVQGGVGFHLGYRF